ncbi:hypothetical protein FNV43_RR17509 [Rhamnella rubrinervis]|uniref:RING-type E3 ubiquitin transferase n=1 Tax=Rhamnella rubrinervis TaxID=2594499 RepID=A0A8K0E4B8_9ROSA|nr:hypothetical protein FNV43_RR17509 [Rhamnella rubrinervis]
MKHRQLNFNRPIFPYAFNFHNATAFGVITWSWSMLIMLLLIFSPVYGQLNPEPTTELQNNTTYGYLANFNSSMAVVIVFLVCAFFMMGFFSIYLRRCAESQIVTARNLGQIAVGSSRGPGLDRLVIDSFPIFVYSAVKDLKIGKGALECAVCLSEFEDYDTLRLLPKCDHVFHPDCIDAWLASHVTCPVCRAKLAPTDGGERCAGDSAQTTEPNREGSASELQSEEDDQMAMVIINVDQNHSTDSHSQAVGTANSAVQGSVKQNRPPRSGIHGRFPRSHSTGHSMPVQPGENTERYTLRLPEEVRRQLAMTGNNLKRSISYDVLFARDGSSRKGYRRQT